MRRTLVSVLVVAVVLAAGVYGLRRAWSSVFDRVATGCTFSSMRTGTDQAAVAAEMVSVVVSRRLPTRAAVLVLAAGLQESKLRNIPAGSGDRDSVGVLQQRPSQGWGTATELADVRYATGAFLDRLVKFSSWRTEPLSAAIQKVQVSADGNAYAQHEPQAQAMAVALTGTQARGIRCTFAPVTGAPAATVAARLTDELPVSRARASGRTVSVPGAGWATASWLVAHAQEFGIDSVTCKGARWQRSKGWSDDAGAPTGAVTATLRP
ncbi:MAG: hypothetical protein ABJA87_07595 [bacterium]